MIAQVEIDAVCKCVPRKTGKFKAPPSDQWLIERMYVNVPGQYNVVMKMKRKSKYQRYFDEELGVIVPPYNDDSEDSFFTKPEPNIAPVDEDYDVLYDEDDAESNSESNHNSDENNEQSAEDDNKNKSGDDSSESNNSGNRVS